MLKRINNLFRPARLSRRRIILAVVVALAADGLQVPLQVPPLPEIIDVVAMVLTTVTIGFHVLLLPTFAVEFVPGVDLLPTWTGCVMAVIVLRLREEKTQSSPTPPPVIPPAIPVESKVEPQPPPKTKF